MRTLRFSQAPKSILLSDLPSVGRASAARSSGIARRIARHGRERSVALPGVGPVVVELASLAEAGQTPLAPCESFAVELEGQRGRLCIDTYLALHLVTMVLGGPAPALPRALGRAERGLLAALVVQFINQLEAGTLRVGLAAPPPASALGCVGLKLVIRTPGWQGWGLLEVPERTLAAAPDDGGTLDEVLRLGSHLATAVAVEIGRTVLSAKSLAEVDTGDAVVFEGLPRLDVEAPWPVRLRVGSREAAAELRIDGTLQKLARFVHEEGGRLPMSAENREAADVLAGAPVEIVAEVGRVTLRGDEVVGLVGGSVLSLGSRRTDAVELRVAGQLWAKGELVAIDDQLGVRITRIVGRQP